MSDFPNVRFGELHHFNTGRYYGPEKQPITWARYSDGNTGNTGIVFTDHARGITKLLPNPGQPGICRYNGGSSEQTSFGEASNNYVLTLYDAYIEHPVDSYEVERQFNLHLRDSKH